MVHLKSSSEIEFAWLAILVRLCGDFPELWRPSKSPPFEISGTWEDENLMALDNPSAASLQTPQSMPIELPDSSSVDGAQDEVTSAGPSAIFDNDFDL